MPVDAKVPQLVTRLKMKYAERDRSMGRAQLVRAGKIHEVYPQYFSEDYPESIVANFMDQAARDYASNLAPLPSLACSAGSMKTSADKRRAEKKNRIGANYWKVSDLEFQNKYGADWYYTYGFVPYWVEPDFKNKTPRIHVINPIGCYYVLDRHLECRQFVRSWREDIAQLAQQWPENSYQIMFDANGRPRQGDTEVIQYLDDKTVLLYLPDIGGGLVLAQYQHGLSRCPVHIAVRPGCSEDPRGHFDDVISIQAAHSRIASLTLEAGDKAVQAPLAVPSDVNEIAIGPDAVIVTDHPEKIQRVPLMVPQAAFALGQELAQEMKEGAGYPDSRLGVGPSGGSTGRGITALEGGFDSGIKSDQDVIGRALRESTKMCFEVDRVHFGRVNKTIRGNLSGESYEVKYRANVDLIDDVEVQITYGFASGTSPEGGIVTLLQLRGDQLVGRDFVRRNLPFDIDVDQQQREIDVLAVEDALKQGLSAGLQASGQMIAQGMAAEASQFFLAAAQIIKGRQDGKPIADLILEAFKPPEQPQQVPGVPGAPGDPNAPQGAPGGAATGPNGEPLDGVLPNGLPQGVAPGQAGMPPGGRPPIQDLTAGFKSGGAPNMQATVRRRIATG